MPDNQQTPVHLKDTRQLVDEFVKRFGDKYVWQVDTFLLQLARDIQGLNPLDIETTEGSPNGGVPVKRVTIKLPENCEVNIDEEKGTVIIDI